MAGNIHQHTFLYRSVIPVSPPTPSDDSPFPSPESQANTLLPREGGAYLAPLLRPPTFSINEDVSSDLYSDSGTAAARMETDGERAEEGGEGGAGPTSKGREGGRLKRYQKPLNESYRFLQLVIGGFGCICASTTYVFNLTSKDLQQKYDFSQSQMTTITTVGSVVGSLTLPFGVLYDYGGARPIFLIGMILYPMGGVLIGLAFADVIVGSVWSFAVFTSMQSVGTSMFDLGAVMTLMSIFPANRGSVVAVMKTLTGLGAALIGTLKLAFFDDDPGRFFFFLSLMVSTVGMLSVLFVEVPPYHITGYERSRLTQREIRHQLKTKHVYLSQKPPPQRFMIGLVIVSFLILYFPIQGAMMVYLRLGHSWSVVFAIVALIVLALYTVMALPIQALELQRERTRTIVEALFDEDDTSSDDGNAVAGDGSSLCGAAARETVGLLSSRRSHRKSGRRSRRSWRKQRVENAADDCEVEYIAPQYKSSFMQNLTKMHLWALFWTLFCVSGAETAVINNARFLYSALAEKEIDSNLATLLTVLQGVGSGLGRMIMSYLEVKTQKRPAEDRIPITFALFLPTTSIILMFLFFFFLPYFAPSLLIVPFFICALGNGFTAASIVIVIRTIFAEDPAKHYNFCFLSGLASSVALNRYLYGSWYTYKANQQSSARTASSSGSGIGGVSDKLCYGQECVLLPMLVMLALNLTAFGSSLYVHVSYSRYSRSVLDGRRRKQSERASALLAIQDDSGVTDGKVHNAADT